MEQDEIILTSDIASEQNVLNINTQTDKETTILSSDKENNANIEKKPVTPAAVDALKLWIEKTLRTQLNKYPIYKGTRYGANIDDLVIGKSFNFDFAESELRREIETALLRHEDIQSMSGFSAERKGAALSVSFTLKTIYGEISEVYEYDD